MPVHGEMDRSEEVEDEDKVFVCSIHYSALMDTSGATDQDEKTSLEEASTSGASSGSGSESSSPGSPRPLVPGSGERVVQVGRNGITFTNVKHSPLFKTKLPHLSAHSLALTAGTRKTRYRSPYPSSDQYAQPGSYEKWSKQRKTSKWTRRRRLERPLLWLATAILILLLIAGIMIAVFWVADSGTKDDGSGKVIPLNDTNMNVTSHTTAGSTSTLLISTTILLTKPTTTMSPPSTMTSSTKVMTTSFGSTSPSTLLPTKRITTTATSTQTLSTLTSVKVSPTLKSTTSTPSSLTSILSSQKSSKTPISPDIFSSTITQTPIHNGNTASKNRENSTMEPEGALEQFQELSQGQSEGQQTPGDPLLQQDQLRQQAENKNPTDQPP